MIFQIFERCKFYVYFYLVLPHPSHYSVRAHGRKPVAQRTQSSTHSSSVLADVYLSCDHGLDCASQCDNNNNYYAAHMAAVCEQIYNNIHIRALQITHSCTINSSSSSRFLSFSFFVQVLVFTTSQCLLQEVRLQHCTHSSSALTAAAALSQSAPTSCSQQCRALTATHSSRSAFFPPNTASPLFIRT